MSKTKLSGPRGPGPPSACAPSLGRGLHVAARTVSHRPVAPQEIGQMAPIGRGDTKHFLMLGAFLSTVTFSRL